jgi:dolichol-phosphate mannosyltransferase
MKSVVILWKLDYWRQLRRYAQFCLVGGSGVFVDMGVVWVLADPSTLAWNLTLSKVIAAEVAIVNNFLWNDLWTFRGLGAERSRWRARIVRFGKFNLICVAGVAWSVLLLNFQVHGLRMNIYLANFIAIVIVSLWNFLLNLKFGWNEAGKGCQAAIDQM